MSFGFQVKNGAGQDILRGREETYLLYKKGRIYRTFQRYPYEGHYDGHIYDILGGLSIYDNPLIFASVGIGAQGFNVYVGIVPRGINYSTGAIYDPTAVINLSGYGVGSAWNAVIDYYVFAPARKIPLPAYGMALYNDSGTLAFHNGAKPLNIAGFVTAPQTSVWTTTTPIGYGRNDGAYAYRMHRGYMLGRHGYNGPIVNKSPNTERFAVIRRSDY